MAGRSLRPASWPEAFAVAARGLAGAGAGAVLTGGRITAEDGYAYSKFARVALGTNDIDFRSRPLSAEETSFLASEVVLRQGATYADLEAAATVVLAGLEPEDEAGAIFLRLRKATAQGPHPCRLDRTVRLDVASRSSTASSSRPSPAARRGPARTPRARRTRHRQHAVLLVGERLAMSPGALSAAAEVASKTGAKLAWVPRRAGDRGAVETGCLPAASRRAPGRRPGRPRRRRHDLGCRRPARSPGRDADEIVAAVNAGELHGLVVGGVDPDDTADPAAFRAALDRASFVVALELRESDVTRVADVVFPVAARE